MFHLDYSPVSSGKSHRAIEWLAQDPSNRVILIPYHRMGDLLMQEVETFWPKAGITRQNLISFPQLRGFTFREGIQVYVDQLDGILSQLIGAEVAGASWTETEDGPDGLVRKKLSDDPEPRRRVKASIPAAHFALIKTPA